MIPLAGYLDTSFRPDREYIDGETRERNVAEYGHSNLQDALVAWRRNRQCKWNIHVLPEQRVQVSSIRFRVSDVCDPARPGDRAGVHEAPSSALRSCRR
ncbi:MAG: hypothetical protein ACRD4P_11525 [Bryobacteraceae bacterium]